MNVDSLLQLSTIACQAEALENGESCAADKSSTSQSVQYSPSLSEGARKSNNEKKDADSVQVVSTRSVFFPDCFIYFSAAQV